MWFLLTLSLGFANECEVCCSNLEPREESMTYIYYQDSGKFFGGQGKFRINTFGYSGNNTNGYIGQNNPEYECMVKVGPAPVNTYKLGPCSDSMSKYPIRPCTFPLIPQIDRPDCVRKGLSVHGCQCCSEDNRQCDNTEPPCGFCSGGCIVISKEHRLKLREGDTIKVEKHDPDYSKVHEF